MIPYHQLVGEPDAPHLGFVLHGAMGAGHNFRSFVKRLSAARPEYRYALIDLRYHGNSLGAPPPHTLDAAAGDLFDLALHLGQSPRVVVGHSLGGKVALVYGKHALAEGTNAPHAATLRQAWALDSDPGVQTPTEEHQVLRVLGALLRHRGPFATRAEAVESIASERLSSGLAQWLATNLERTRTNSGEHFTWKLDLDEIHALLSDYFRTDLWPFLADRATATTGETTFELLVAERSDRWSGSMRERAAHLPTRGAVRLHELHDSGHWVHVDNPAGLLEILKTHLA